MERQILKNMTEKKVFSGLIALGLFMLGYRLWNKYTILCVIMSILLFNFFLDGFPDIINWAKLRKLLGMYEK